MAMNRITILTATLNAELYIGRLIESLRNQTDRNFEWIVLDGCSTDSTCELIKEEKELKIKLICEKDFGIYDALNRGLNFVAGGYYIVMGADDVLSPNAVEQYRSVVAAECFDIVTASVIYKGRAIRPRKNLGWLYGMSGVAGSHAVGMLINSALHVKYGLYSKKFPIAADQLFVKKCIAGGATIKRVNFIAGEFSSDGVSSVDAIGLITEVFRVQLLTERYHFIQYMLYMVRLFKFYVKNRKF